jgi:hypothetical protein
MAKDPVVLRIYQAIWIVEVIAESPLEAARQAQAIAASPEPHHNLEWEIAELSDPTGENNRLRYFTVDLSGWREGDEMVDDITADHYWEEDHPDDDDDDDEDDLL